MNTKKSLLPLLLLIFLDSFGYFLVIPVLLRLIYGAHGLMSAATLDEKNIVMGIAIAVGFLAMIIAAPLVGGFSDRFGRKKTFLGCLIISLLGFLIPILGIYQRQIYLIVAGRFIAGVGSASQPVAQAAVADIAEGKQKALYLSFIAFAMTLALVLGPLTGGYLSDTGISSIFTNATPYWIGCAVVVLNILLLLSLFSETLVKHVNKHELNLSKIIFGILPAVKQYKIGALLLAVFLLELGWSQYYNAVMLFLGQQYHYSTEQITNFASYMGVLMCFGLLLLYPLLIKFFRVKTILKAGMALVAVGMLGCAFVPSVIAQWLFVIPVTIFVGISYVGLLALISDKVAQNQQGWVMGYAMTALALAWFITSFISGWLLNINLFLPFIVAAAVLLLTLVLLLFYQDNGKAKP